MNKWGKLETDKRSCSVKRTCNRREQCAVRYVSCQHVMERLLNVLTETVGIIAIAVMHTLVAITIIKIAQHDK